MLRLLPGYYRDKWEEDMVAAFLDSWMTGDPDEDSVTMEYDRPSRQEIASVVGLAARLYLGGAGTPRRYFAWGQAVRLAVLAVVLVHAAQGLADLTLLTWRRHLAGWFPALPASLAGPVPRARKGRSSRSPSLDGSGPATSRCRPHAAKRRGAGRSGREPPSLRPALRIRGFASPAWSPRIFHLVRSAPLATDPGLPVPFLRPA